jgi:hypothetical protein
MFLLRSVGSFLLRFAERQFLALLFHDPPRNERVCDSNPSQELN